MTLTEQINNIVEQASGLLTLPDMSGWRAPPDCTDEDAERLELEEIDRRMQARLDLYLADRADRLSMLRAVSRAASERSASYRAQSEPWLKMAKRQEALAAYCAQLASNILVAERASRGGNVGEPYRVTLPNGTSVGLRVTKVVQVSDIDSLPAKFVRSKTTREADKNAIKALLVEGKDVPGARLGTNEHVDWGR